MLSTIVARDDLGCPRSEVDTFPCSLQLFLRWELFLAGNVILLLVDDEALIRMSLQTILTDAGFTVMAAANAAEAIAQLDNPDNNLSGLITDIRLGIGKNGWDVARHARELNPSMPVVYMTGDSADEWASLGVPNSSLVHKPFADVQIITAISNLLNAASERSQR